MTIQSTDSQTLHNAKSTNMITTCNSSFANCSIENNIYNQNKSGLHDYGRLVYVEDYTW